MTYEDIFGNAEIEPKYPKMESKLYDYLFKRLIDKIIRHYKIIKQQVVDEHNIVIHQDPLIKDAAGLNFYTNIFAFDNIKGTQDYDAVIMENISCIPGDLSNSHHTFESIEELQNDISSAKQLAYDNFIKILEQDVLEALTNEERQSLNYVMGDGFTNNNHSYVRMGLYNKDSKEYDKLKYDTAIHNLKTFNESYYRILSETHEDNLDVLRQIVDSTLMPIYSDIVAYSEKKYNEIIDLYES